MWSHDNRPDGRQPGQYHGSYLVTERSVLAGSDAWSTGHLYAFDRASGAVRWKVRFPKGVAADLARHGETVLMVSQVGDVAAVGIDDGAFRWRVEPDRTGPVGQPLDAVLADDRWIVAWKSGVVDAYGAAEGRLLWRRDLGTSLGAAPVVIDGEVVVGAYGGRLFRLRASDGETLGDFRLGGALYGEIVAAPGCLLALSARGGADPEKGPLGPHAIACVDPELRGVRWSYRTSGLWTTFAPIVLHGVVVAGTEGRLIALDLERGEVAWERTVDGSPRGLLAFGDRLYLGTKEGAISALPWPR